MRMKRKIGNKSLSPKERKINALELRYEGLEERKRDLFNEGLYFDSPSVIEIEEEQGEIVKKLNRLYDWSINGEKLLSFIKESAEQQKCVEYLTILEKQKKIITFFAPMNENILSFLDRYQAIKVENKAKTMGKKKGVSDLVVILKNKILFIELKRAGKKLKNGKISYAGIKVSENQKSFLENIKKSNVCDGFVAYGFDDFYKKIKSYL